MLSWPANSAWKAAKAARRHAVRPRRHRERAQHRAANSSSIRSTATPRSERNVLDRRLEETVKEFSAIDGAFVVRGDGVVLAAGRYLVPQGPLEEPSPQGLGTRHEAVAGITVDTDALALCISQSTGTVSIFRGSARRRHPEAPQPRTDEDSERTCLTALLTAPPIPVLLVRNRL